MEVVNNQAVIINNFINNFKLLKNKIKKTPKDLKFIYTALQRKMLSKLSPS